MIFAGLLITLLGFVISVLSLTLTDNTGARMTIVLLGIALSLFGIIGVLNRHYMKNAIWRR
jgi:uncharacterized membrane protein YccC